MEYIIETYYPYRFYPCKNLKEAKQKKRELKKQNIKSNIVVKNEYGNDYILA